MAPRLSVVVPIYNVESYLQECLDSIAAQTFADFECVMVDDGSTDGSAAMAEAYASTDPRFRLVRQQNQGLGAARNTGWRNASADAEYLTFVDSDDIVPADAYERMINSLDKSGSDFAAGNVLRLVSDELVPSRVHLEPFRTELQATHVTQLPTLVRDRTAWNKVYRRSFFDGAGLLYPEGMLYEDAPVSIPLHFAATSVDVFSEPVYHWRIREAGALSITQKRTDPQGLVDRVHSIELVRGWLAARPEPENETYLRAYDANTLREEIPMFFAWVSRGDRPFRLAYQQHVSRLLQEMGPDRLEALSGPLRLKYRLTLTDHIGTLVLLQRVQQRYWALRRMLTRA
ncbi:glycosyltransferase family 2 protein [Streptacidiphilus rugosus]|uniref:glycosyltransferase family 2 protein n=1 Tax=Streptacidiphilus rugosus TaxID=405783 RepID=UPI0005641CDF|nr:glycosyltransferase family 2 protein [Streptacidiphilus rugosus]